MTVELDTGRLIHRADDTGPDEYATCEDEINLAINDNGSIYYESNKCKDKDADFYITFENDSTFTAKIYAGEEIGEINSENREGIIAIVDNADEDWYGLIHKDSIEDDCKEIANHILDKLDTYDLEFEDDRYDDGIEEREYDPDDPRY